MSPYVFVVAELVGAEKTAECFQTYQGSEKKSEVTSGVFFKLHACRRCFTGLAQPHRRPWRCAAAHMASGWRARRQRTLHTAVLNQVVAGFASAGAPVHSARVYQQAVTLPVQSALRQSATLHSKMPSTAGVSRTRPSERPQWRTACVIPRRQ